MIPVKSKGDEPLETLLNKATNPLNPETDWTSINSFCIRVDEELEGPIIALRLLAHKIHSPQEKEALYSFLVLEECVKQCNHRFYQEVAKYRFLNELIKVISPKYMGSYTCEEVKKRCIEFFYSIYKSFPNDQKVSDAYSMLKRQGIIKEDPTYMDAKLAKPLHALPPRTSSIFDTDQRSAELSRLLKSRNPNDLQAANRLIKSLVKEDIEKSEKVSKRLMDVETVKNNTKLLAEMLNQYRPGNASADNIDIMKQLFENIKNARPALILMVSECEDKDNKDSDTINQVLRVNDDAFDVMKKYCQLVQPSVDPHIMLHINTGDATIATTSSHKDEADLLKIDGGDDLTSVVNKVKSSTEQSLLMTSDVESLSCLSLNNELNTVKLEPLLASTGHQTSVSNSSNKYSALRDVDLLDDLIFHAPGNNCDLDNLGSTSAVNMQSHNNLKNNVNILNIGAGMGNGASGGINSPVFTKNEKSHGFEDLTLLGKQMLKKQPAGKDVEALTSSCATVKSSSSSITDVNKISPTTQSFINPLSNIHLTLDQIKPLLPQPSSILLLDNTCTSKLKLELHITDAQAISNAGQLLVDHRILVLVAVLTSYSSQGLHNVEIGLSSKTQDVRIKALAQSGSVLLGCIPFAPNPFISQIVLIDATDLDHFPLHYRVTCVTSAEPQSTLSESGHVDDILHYFNQN